LADETSLVRCGNGGEGSGGEGFPTQEVAELAILDAIVEIGEEVVGSHDCVVKVVNRFHCRGNI
jgi:hypothetical protein